jgi:hypothetical protein
MTPMHELTSERFAELAWAQGRIRPMPKRRVELPFERTFTPDEVTALRAGLLPEVMEDKWIGLLHEGTIDLYRSWTGNHIYRLSLRQGAEGLVADRLTVNREPRQYGGKDDAWDIEFVGFLLGRWLRGETA